MESPSPLLGRSRSLSEPTAPEPPRDPPAAAAFQASPLAALVYAPDGRCLDCNGAARALFGLPVSADSNPAVEQRTAGLERLGLCGERALSWLSRLEPALAAQGRGLVDLSAERADGRPLSLSVTVTPLPGGERAAYFEEREQPEGREGRSSKRKAHSDLHLLWRAFEQSPFCILLTDAQGRIEFVNAAFTRVVGYPLDEVRGQNPRLLRSKETPPEVYEELWRRIGSGRDWRGELCNRRKDGAAIWVESWISPVVDLEGRITHFLQVFEDATARRSLAAQLQVSQRMEAVGRLAGGIAHDFNNVLTIVLASASFLAEEIDEPDPRRQDVLDIRRAAERAASLTRQLLAFSRRHNLQPEVVDLNLVVANVEKMVRRLVGEDVLLHVSSSPQPAYVVVDPGQVEQVILNLVVNARDAMPDGGDLHLGVSCEEAPQGRIELVVRDTGAGMDEETRRRCLEPLFTTKQGGTGLGLTLVDGILKQAHGELRIESAVGQGTALRLHFPAAPPPSMEGLSAPRPGRPAFQQGTVLLLEDEPDVRHGCRRALERAGFEVLEAGHGDEALQLARDLRARGAPLRLILSDVVLPGRGGPAVVEELQVLHPGARALFMSGYTDDAVLQRGLSSTRVALLHKPFTPDLLLRRVLESLAGDDPAGVQVP